MMLYLLLVFVLFVQCLNSQVLPFDRRASDRLTEDALELLALNAHNTPCWREAIESLVRSCKQIEADDVAKSRFAVQLTNCHLAKSGRDTYSCTSSMSIEQCTSSMDSVAFSSYTSFYVSSEHICYYLQTEFFQNMTEQKITQLYVSVSDSIDFLQTLQTQTESMKASMSESLDNQKELFSTMNTLHSNLEVTRDSVENLNVVSDKIKLNIDYTLQNQDKIAEAQLLLLDEQKNAARETYKRMSELIYTAEDISTRSIQSLEYQKELLTLQSKTVDGILGLGEMADQTIVKQRQLLEGQRLLESEHEKAREFYELILHSLEKLTFVQQLLMSEFLDMHAIAFYSLIAGLAFLLTTTNQTYSARLWLFVSLPVFVGLEILMRQKGWDTVDTFVTHHQNIWLFRTRVVPAFMLLILLRSVWLYTDQVKMHLTTQSMLQEVLRTQREHNNMIKTIMEHQELCPGDGSARTRGYENFLRRLSPFREVREDSHLVVVNE